MWDAWSLVSFFYSCLLLSCLDLAEHSLGPHSFQLAKKHVDTVVTVRYCLSGNLTTSPLEVFHFKRRYPMFYIIRCIASITMPNGLMLHHRLTLLKRFNTF